MIDIVLILGDALTYGRQVTTVRSYHLRKNGGQAKCRLFVIRSRTDLCIWSLRLQDR